MNRKAIITVVLLGIACVLFVTLLHNSTNVVVHTYDVEPNDNVLVGWIGNLQVEDPNLSHINVQEPDGVVFATIALPAGWKLDVIDVNCVSDETIRHLCESGRVCEVMGHQWRDGRPGEGEDSQYADHHPGVFYRTCRLCEKCEKQSLSQWE